MNTRREKLKSLFMEAAARFLAIESNRNSLITVTNARLSEDLTAVTILVTVLPIEREETALAFANRRQGDFRDYIAKHARIRELPRFTFALDEGERNRQHIDELLRADPNARPFGGSSTA